MDPLNRYEVYVDGETFVVTANKAIVEETNSARIVKFIKDLRVMAMFYNVTGWIEIESNVDIS